MNMLAHIYLSGEEDLVKIGNFIGDYIKGKRYLDYRPLIQKGVLLHRSIDHFTDHHRKPRRIKKLLRPVYHKYSGIVVDIYYDHFLTTNWDIFSEKSLIPFVEAFHQTLREKFQMLPASVQSFVPRMIESRRLLSYGKMEGVRNALNIMSKHTSLPNNTNFALEVLTEHYDYISENFSEFFPQLIAHVKKNHRVNLPYDSES